MDVPNGIAASALAGANWRKASMSGPTGNCVELAALDGEDVAIRNSRFPGGPALIFPRAQVRSLLQEVQAGALDYLLAP